MWCTYIDKKHTAVLLWNWHDGQLLLFVDDNDDIVDGDDVVVVGYDHNVVDNDYTIVGGSHTI